MACNKYQSALIYTIKTDNGLYVGSTCNFAKRKDEHKSNCFNEKSKQYNLKVYKNIRENGGEYSIEIYKMFPCNSKEELYIAEENVRKEINANLNSLRCFRTKEDKKQQKKECEKRYYMKHNDKIKQYQKKHYSENSDIRNEKNKEYQQKNKEIISKQRSEKVTCECGCEVSRRNIARHIKSQYHINLINQVI